MARIERADSSVPVPVERAQLQTTVQRTPFIDPSRFPFSRASAEAFKVAGNVLEEIRKRGEKAQDSLSINAAGESRDLAKLEMKQFMLNNPDPDTWAEGLSKIKAGHRKRTVNLRFSKEAFANEQVEQKAFDDELGIGVQIQAAAQNIENDITVSGKNLINKIANSEDTDQENLEVIRQTELYQEALERKYTKEVAAIHMEENLGEAEKQRISVLVERKDFKGARELTSVTKGLTAVERIAQMNFINNAETRANKALDAANREKKLALYQKEDAGEDLTRDDFNEAWRDPAQADQHYDEYVTGQRAEQQGEVNFIKKGDPIIIARTEAIIDLNPMAITEAQLYENSTRGIGTENITGMVDRLRKAQAGLYAPIKKYDTQFATLLNAKYFGEKDEIETSTRYLDMKRKMKEFIDSQKPIEAIADAFFKGLITKNFTGFRRGGWEEKGFKHTYIDTRGNEVTQRFRFGDIRTKKIGKKMIVEFYAGTDKNGDALWLPRQ